MSETVTLHCQSGNHTWERPKQRGRRPIDCPEHSVKREATGRTRNESLAEARAIRQENAAAILEWEHDTLYPHVKDNDGNYGFEARRVLRFTDQRLAEYALAREAVEDPKELDSNSKLMSEVRDRILSRVRNTYGHAPREIVAA